MPCWIVIPPLQVQLLRFDYGMVVLFVPLQLVVVEEVSIGMMLVVVAVAVPVSLMFVGEMLKRPPRLQPP